MTAICDNRKCNAVATRMFRAKGLTVTKNICESGDCVFWVRAWFDVRYPQSGGHSLSYEPLGVGVLR